MLGGPTNSPRFLSRLQVPLCDLNDDDARQPYHVVAERDEKRGMILVQETSKTATELATRATRELLKRADEGAHRVRAAALVVGSNVDPASIRQPHIRAHALEGRLYRDAVEAAVSGCGLVCLVFVEREALPKAAAAIGRPPKEIKAVMGATGKGAGRPWGSHEKMAAMAAWVALASPDHHEP
jgi:hypothetical protein